MLMAYFPSDIVHVPFLLSFVFYLPQETCYSQQEKVVVWGIIIIIKNEI